MLKPPVTVIKRHAIYSDELEKILTEWSAAIQEPFLTAVRDGIEAELDPIRQENADFQQRLAVQCEKLADMYKALRQDHNDLDKRDSDNNGEVLLAIAELSKAMPKPKGKVKQGES